MFLSDSEFRAVPIGARNRSESFGTRAVSEFRVREVPRNSENETHKRAFFYNHESSLSTLLRLLFSSSLLPNAFLCFLSFGPRCCVMAPGARKSKRRKRLIELHLAQKIVQSAEEKERVKFHVVSDKFPTFKTTVDR